MPASRSGLLLFFSLLLALLLNSFCLLLALLFLPAVGLLFLFFYRQARG